MRAEISVLCVKADLTCFLANTDFHVAIAMPDSLDFHGPNHRLLFDKQCIISKRRHSHFLFSIAIYCLSFEGIFGGL